MDNSLNKLVVKNRDVERQLYIVWKSIMAFHPEKNYGFKKLFAILKEERPEWSFVIQQTDSDNYIIVASEGNKNYIHTVYVTEKHDDIINVIYSLKDGNFVKVKFPEYINTECTTLDEEKLEQKYAFLDVSKNLYNIIKQKLDGEERVLEKVYSPQQSKKETVEEQINKYKKLQEQESFEDYIDNLLSQHLEDVKAERRKKKKQKDRDDFER